MMHLDAGTELPAIIGVEGMLVGLITCYDLRFAELELSLVQEGAEMHVLPAAWVRAPQNEHH